MLSIYQYCKPIQYWWCQRAVPCATRQYNTINLSKLYIIIYLSISYITIYQYCKSIQSCWCQRAVPWASRYYNSIYLSIVYITIYLSIVYITIHQYCKPIQYWWCQRAEPRCTGICFVNQSIKLNRFKNHRERETVDKRVGKEAISKFL